MLDLHDSESSPELPLDFTQFLSERLSLEPPATLALLGTFLVTFEPTGTYPQLGLSTQPSLYADPNHLPSSR